MLTGVVEVGLFCHMAQAAYFGNEVDTCCCAHMRPNLPVTISHFHRMVASQSSGTTVGSSILDRRHHETQGGMQRTRELDRGCLYEE
jgi:hypothetical protein